MADNAELHAVVPDQEYKGWVVRWRGWIYPPHYVAITGHWIAWQPNVELCRQTILVSPVGERLETAFHLDMGWGLMVPRYYTFTGMEPPGELLAARERAHAQLLREIDNREEAAALRKRLTEIEPSHDS